MSECVVRMERVPKNCDDGCWGSLSGECPWCDSIDGYKMVGNRPPNCPIITVLPEGHGDLIDRDTFISKYLSYYTEQERELNLMFAAVEVKQQFADMICDEQAIVPAKRKVDASDAVAPTDTPTDTPTVPAERSET